MALLTWHAFEVDQAGGHAEAEFTDLGGVEGDLYLAPGIARVGEEARQYKATALLDLIDRGSSLRAGYGNADSDFAAFSDAGLGPESIYVIGELAGDPVGVPVPDGDAYTNHLAGLTIPEGCP